MKWLSLLLTVLSIVLYKMEVYRYVWCSVLLIFVRLWDGNDYCIFQCEWHFALFPHPVYDLECDELDFVWQVYKHSISELVVIDTVSVICWCLYNMSAKMFVSSCIDVWILSCVLRDCILCCGLACIRLILFQISFLLLALSKVWGEGNPVSFIILLQYLFFLCICCVFFFFPDYFF